MLVRATQKGYYGVVIRDEGHVFKLTDPDHFTEVWMEKVMSESKNSKGAKGSAKAESQGARPLPPSEDEVAARIRAADEMAMEASKEDADVI